MIISEIFYRYRVLDTRAKFILLHDHRLFHSTLQYLWKKIVNVIFLREHGRHHGSVLLSHENVHPWYDISTVPFPLPIHNTIILYHLDTWHQGRFHSGVDLFREKTSDLRGQQFRVVTFQHLPASIKMANVSLGMDSLMEGEGPTSFGGLEIEVCVKKSQKYWELQLEICVKKSQKYCELQLEVCVKKSQKYWELQLEVCVKKSQKYWELQK